MHLVENRSGHPAQRPLSLQSLGIRDPGPVLTEAWDYFRSLCGPFDDFTAKLRVGGLTAIEQLEYTALGVSCLAAHHVIDALIDAHNGVFHTPVAYAGYAV